MSPPRAWKLKREFARLGRQIRGAHAHFVSYLLARPYYDLVLSRRVRWFFGQMPLSEKVAVYLVFPDRGVLSSHLAALDYLGSSGYAPLVVSNVPIRDADRDAILARSYLLLERPNFGYDFGGYRDAILSLGAKRLARLDRLVLLNDSCWFPLPGGMDWLTKAEALGVDYAAAAWHGAVAPRDPETYELVEWNIRKDRRNFHYASFALSISATILKSRAFWRFWKQFRLTNQKHRTVRRGEIGLTRWVMQRGFSHAATMELARFDKELAAMNEAQLEEIFSRLVLVADPKTNDRWRAVMGPEAPSLTRKQKEKLILALTSREGASYALADYIVRRRHFAFLKKSSLRGDSRAAAILLDTIEGLESEFGATIRAEAWKIMKGVVRTSPRTLGAATDADASDEAARVAPSGSIIHKQDGRSI